MIFQKRKSDIQYQKRDRFHDRVNIGITLHAQNIGRLLRKPHLRNQQNLSPFGPNHCI